MNTNIKIISRIIIKRQSFRSFNTGTIVLSTNIPKETAFASEPLGDKVVGATIDHHEITQHERLRHDWWNKEGPMKPLHSLNKLRIQFVRDGLLNTLPFLEGNRNTSKPLKGIKILDVGCGGGILSEPLSRLGATMTGLDASDQLIALAREHSKQRSLENIQYVNDSIENFAASNEEQFDGVVASEIIEHVNNKDLFIQSCIRTLKPGGSIFITTLNKTNLSWLGGIVIVEYLLRIVPQGTHHWEKFISPLDMSRLLDKYGCKTKIVHGMMYILINNQWIWTSNTSINYAIQAVKNIS